MWTVCGCGATALANDMLYPQREASSPSIRERSHLWLNPSTRLVLCNKYFQLSGTVPRAIDGLFMIGANPESGAFFARGTQSKSH